MARAGETNWPSNCLFHYTDRVNAEDIAEDGYFEGDARDNVFDGLVVLLGDDPFQRFVEVDRRVFLLPAEEGMGELIQLQRILVATGIRIRGRWQFIRWV